jgi:hypothetical protein
VALEIEFRRQDEPNTEDRYSDAEVIAGQVEVFFERVESCLAVIDRLSVVPLAHTARGTGIRDIIPV